MSPQPPQMSTQAISGNYSSSNKNSSTGIRGKVSQIGTYVKSNPASVKVIGGIGGVGLTAISIMCCFAVFNSFLSPLTYIMNVFFLIFGLSISIVSIFPESGPATTIYGQVGFLSTLHGRAIFFLYLGILLFGSGLSGSMASWAYLLVGSWMLLASVIFFVMKCRGVESDLAGTSSV